MRPGDIEPGAAAGGRAISDEQEARGALRSSEERYRQIIETVHEGIHELDAGLRTTFANPRMAEMLGYSPAEMEGLALKAIVHPADHAKLKQRVARHRRGSAGQYELRFRRKDGSTAWGLVSSRPLFDPKGAFAGLLVAVTDITDRKETEEALWESETRFIAFMNHCPAIAWMKDEQGRYAYVNQPFTRRFNRAEEEWYGRTDADFWPTEVAHSLVQADQAVLASGRPREFHESVPDPDGSLRCWWVFKFPFTDRAGRRFAGGMALDVTERNQLEAQIRQLMKMEAIGLLAGGVAHEFNNLLGVILGHTELIALRLESVDRVQRQLDEIRRAAERGAALTRQILLFSRKELASPKVFDLNQRVAEQEEMLRRLIGEDVQLVTVRAKEIGTVSADPGLIDQVIMNLVLNARDAMPTGGRLTLETRNLELADFETRRPSALQPGRYVMLAVTDTGSGIEETLRERVFEPFFTTKEVGQGTGLGLSATYGIVKQSGGHIELESQVGHGTTFRVYLPRAAGDTPSAPAAAPGWPGAGAGTILLAEDDALLRPLLRELLEMSGYTVLDATDGGDALRQAQQHAGPIDLLIADLVMPAMGGRELATRLTRLLPSMKVLYTSGYTDDVVARHGDLRGEAPFLHKPFRPQALLAKVRQLLG